MSSAQIHRKVTAVWTLSLSRVADHSLCRRGVHCQHRWSSRSHRAR